MPQGKDCLSTHTTAALLRPLLKHRSKAAQLSLLVDQPPYWSSFFATSCCPPSVLRTWYVCQQSRVLKRLDRLLVSFFATLNLSLFLLLLVLGPPSVNIDYYSFSPFPLSSFLSAHLSFYSGLHPAVAVYHGKHGCWIKCDTAGVALRSRFRSVDDGCHSTRP